MHPHQQEEMDAWFSRQDRYDGFDRGDLDRDHAADQLAENEAFAAENPELFRDGDDPDGSSIEEMTANPSPEIIALEKMQVCNEIRADLAKLDTMVAPRFAFVVYTVGDMHPICHDRAANLYRVWGDNIAYFADSAKARRVAAHFTLHDIRCSTATFRAWKAARVDFLKGMLDRLSK